MSAPAQRHTFDLHHYVANPQPVMPADHRIDADLPAGVIAVLAHGERVESGTVAWLRDLLVTPTHSDPVVTAFLTTWAYERHWIGATLRSIVADQAQRGAGQQTEAPEQQRSPEQQPHAEPQTPWHERAAVQISDRVSPALSALSSNVLGRPVVAGHMATGLADTLALRLTFIRLAHMCPDLADLSAAVLRCTEPHLRFYTEQVNVIAATDRRSKRYVHRALKGWRWPGSRTGDRARTGAMLRFLLADPVSRQAVAEADQALARLPGAPENAVIRTDFARFVVHGPLGHNCAYSCLSVRS